jgi:phthalate 4,5-dioxygenase
MLTARDNELISRVGPGTPMGEAFRRFWLPALLSSDLPDPDAPPVRVRILGEDLVAFRDTSGRVGLLDEYCPHRLASLFLARNEEEGLRCVYHGWKFDVAGSCVDMPNEPGDTRFNEKVRAISYPTIELGDVIWAYLGPEDRRPPAPDFEWTRGPSTQRFVSKTLELCNYLQAMEGGMDSVHSNFLHNNYLEDKTGSRIARMKNRAERWERLDVERTNYGLRYAAIRDALPEEGEGLEWAHVHHFVMPFHQYRGGGPGHGGRDLPKCNGHMWVPIDDQTTCVFNWIFVTDPTRPLPLEAALKEESDYGRGPDGESFVRRRTRANDWLIDRQVQRNQTFTGIQGVNTQDLAVQESMGPIVNRTREHLGTTDRAVIVMRQLLLEAVRRVAEGEDPLGSDPAAYRRIRSAVMVLPKGARWQDSEHILAPEEQQLAMST